MDSHNALEVVTWLNIVQFRVWKLTKKNTYCFTCYLVQFYKSFRCRYCILKMNACHGNYEHPLSLCRAPRPDMVNEKQASIPSDIDFDEIIIHWINHLLGSIWCWCVRPWQFPTIMKTSQQCWYKTQVNVQKQILSDLINIWRHRKLTTNIGAISRLLFGWTSAC